MYGSIMPFSKNMKMNFSGLIKGLGSKIKVEKGANDSTKIIKNL